jgi:hypothetical protein
MSEIIVAILMLATTALFIGIALHASRDHKGRSRD